MSYEESLEAEPADCDGVGADGAEAVDPEPDE